MSNNKMDIYAEKLEARLNENLNDPGSEEYKAFVGHLDVTMPRLINENRIPLSISDIMRKRIEVKKKKSKIQYNDWWNYSFCTGDVIVCHPDSSIRFVLDSEHLRKLTPKKYHDKNALDYANRDVNRFNILTAESEPGDEIFLPRMHYESLDGLELDCFHGEKALPRDEIKNHKVWKFLARDKELLSSYATEVSRHLINRQLFADSDPCIMRFLTNSQHPSTLCCATRPKYDDIYRWSGLWEGVPRSILLPTLWSLVICNECACWGIMSEYYVDFYDKEINILIGIKK